MLKENTFLKSPPTLLPLLPPPNTCGRLIQSAISPISAFHTSNQCAQPRLGGGGGGRRRGEGERAPSLPTSPSGGANKSRSLAALHGAQHTPVRRRLKRLHSLVSVHVCAYMCVHVYLCMCMHVCVCVIIYLNDSDRLAARKTTEVWL